jgi:hypothetical protein
VRNWDLREEIADKAKRFGFADKGFLIIDPARFKDNEDGPCHTDIERKRFWTDVLKSLELSLETLFQEALKVNEKLKEVGDDDFISDLSDRIQEIRNAR